MISFDDNGFAFVAPDDADYDAYTQKCVSNGVAPTGYNNWLRVFKRQPSTAYLKAKEESNLRHQDPLARRFR